MTEAELLESIENLAGDLEDVQGSLTLVNKRLGRLPAEYVPRYRARQLVATAAGFLLLLAGFVVWTENKAEGLCKDDRSALRSVIEIAVSDRQPLPTSTPETITAIEELNARTIRPLREKLLSLDGTQPEKC